MTDERPTGRRRLRADVGTVHRGVFDARIPPVLAVTPGQVFELTTLSGGLADLPDPRSGFTVSPEHRAVLDRVPPGVGPHTLTGPIEVLGAEPGDELVVEVIDVALTQDWGWNRIEPGEGALPERFEHERRMHVAIDRDRKTIAMPWGLELRAQPFFGIVGVAPAIGHGPQTSLIPGAFGGNIDNRELGPGARLHLPVFNRGGLLSVGDGHAIQGDGEVCTTAIETGLAGVFSVSLVKGTGISHPWAETPTHLIGMGFDRSLSAAAQMAVSEMVALIQQASDLTAEDAYTLCSIAADLRITQVVNVNLGVHMMLAKALLGG